MHGLFLYLNYFYFYLSIAFITVLLQIVNTGASQRFPLCRIIRSTVRENIAMTTFWTYLSIYISKYLSSHRSIYLSV